MSDGGDSNQHPTERRALFGWGNHSQVVPSNARRSVLLATFLLASFSVCASDLTFFENKIRPLLADQCYSCHSVKAEKTKGGLYVDSLEGLLKGGDSGPALIPGDAEKSLLIKAVRYTDENLQMPPRVRRRRRTKSRKKTVAGGPSSQFTGPSHRS